MFVIYSFGLIVLMNFCAKLPQKYKSMNIEALFFLKKKDILSVRNMRKECLIGVYRVSFRKTDYVLMA